MNFPDYVMACYMLTAALIIKKWIKNSKHKFEFQARFSKNICISQFSIHSH